MHPTLLHFGHITLPTFGVLAAVGLMAALALSLRTATIAGLSPDRLWNAGLFLLLSAFVLSRLLLVVMYLHAFLTYPILLLAVPSLTPLGLLLTGIVTLLYLRVRRLPLLATLDAWAPCATLIWAFLALGHFAEGSDPGLVTTLPWGRPMIAGGIPLHPVALYAAIVAVLLTVVLFGHLRRRPRRGDTAAFALAAVGVAQFLLTFLRQPDPSVELLGNVLDPIQWVAIGMIVAAGIIWLRPRKLVSHAV
ncbi:MAG TPA: prolipoprotein diacylglyceryl transferase family protein [Edaphobacter sp.]|uniref:prolipoprotein diacylglyceryl transferase n=1 Tax=Edaphobacter sp. TaxID=1934404 RepID=UPI002B8535D6|nr:prolipoprotein diacylglyceryl transferase family protein [Edaphobacter sp.]HUZ93778.1 prolipoprotein diacylglyceryl transferase family protein [Edaphobacter sp.]